MLNKDVLFETFMKLESYDKINIISDVLKFSNSFELEFYSSIIESILNYQKLPIENLKEELNNDENILLLKDSECIDSNIRLKLISTLSLLKVSNLAGASHIFEFLRKNYSKFKELAHTNPNTYEEILLIYQLASDHPAFSFNHCQEIYDYLKQIKAVPVLKDVEVQMSDELITDLNVVAIKKNDRQQYIFQIKVTWNRFDCCVLRSLEDVYRFYSRLYELFTEESKSGQICPLFLSYVPDNLEFSKCLMVKFLKDFLNSPTHVLHSDHVRKFFQPHSTDRCICDCDSCRPLTFDNCSSQGDHNGRFEPPELSDCSSSPSNPSDNEEDDDRQYQTNLNSALPSSSYSHFLRFNSASNRRQDSNNSSSLSVGTRSLGHRHRTGCSDNGSEFSVKKPKNRNKNRFLHSSGSSPINTPSDESEFGTKSDSTNKCRSDEIIRHLQKGIEKINVNNSIKDIRTENWLCQSSNSNSKIDPSNKIALTCDNIGNNERKSELESVEQANDFEDYPCDFITDVTQFYHCQIGNLLDWLKQSRLHKYHSFISNLSFGQFHNLNEEILNNLGFVDGASKKLISLIRNLKKTDINLIGSNLINLVSRNRSNSNDSSSRSMYGSCGDVSSAKKSSELMYDYHGNRICGNSCSNVFGMIKPFCCPPHLQPPSFMSMSNFIILSSILPPGTTNKVMLVPDNQEIHRTNIIF